MTAGTTPRDAVPPRAQRSTRARTTASGTHVHVHVHMQQLPARPTMPYPRYRRPRKRNKPWTHFWLFLFTGGIGNAIYAWHVAEYNRDRDLYL